MGAVSLVDEQGVIVRVEGAGAVGARDGSEPFVCGLFADPQRHADARPALPFQTRLADTVPQAHLRSLEVPEALGDAVELGGEGHVVGHVVKVRLTSLTVKGNLTAQPGNGHAIAPEDPDENGSNDNPHESDGTPPEACTYCGDVWPCAGSQNGSDPSPERHK